MPKQALRPLFLVGGLVCLAVLWSSLNRSLVGQVTDAETGQPLAGVAVSVAGQEVVTDAQGSFYLRGLRGVPRVGAQAPGYRPVSGALPSGGLLGLRQTLSLRLEPIELQGTVVDARTGSPLAGATVEVGEQQVRANAQGRYSVKRVLPGAEIRAQAPYYGPSDPVPYEGQPEHDIALTLLPVTVTVRDLLSGRPLAGAVVAAGGETRQSDEGGVVSFVHLPSETEIRATCVGYEEAQGRAGPGDSLVLGLRPHKLRGAVRNAGGEPLAGALVLAQRPGEEPRLAYTDAAGEYELEGVPADTTLVVRQAGYGRVERRLERDPAPDFELEPFVAKGIYFAFHLLRPPYRDQLQGNLDLVDRSELNAVVMEVKTETGYLAWEPRLPLAVEMGAGYDDGIELRALLADCKRRGIYAIARMAIFEDDLLATKRPEWAIQRSSGGVWRAAGGRAWTDPFRREVWDYNIALAKEAVELGFDEIQFDYVRFPSDGRIGDCRYLRESTAESRIEAIAGFIAHARQELDKVGTSFSVDLFGLTTFDTSEQGIGQWLPAIGPHVDYVSPMVYPSTYLPGMLGLQDPWRSPYEVVKLSLDEARKKTPALMRPWLQHYDDYHGLGIKYGLRELRLQKQAADDGQAHGWLFWNILGEYNAEAFQAP